MSLIIEAVTPKFIVSEGPFWDVESQCLYFVDVFGQAICKYIPSTNTYSRGVMPNHNNSIARLSFVIPIKGQPNKFVIGYGSEILKIKWDGMSKSLEKLESIVDIKTAEDSLACWNDAKMDSNGQLWAGYYIPNTEGFSKLKSGGLYFINLKEKTLKKQLDGISLANGMGWNKSNKKFYFADSRENELLQFDSDIDSAKITNKKILFKCSDSGAFPDGMTVDSNDNLWVATFDGNITVIDSNKPNTILQTVKFPVEQVTSCTFGGPNLNELYVTSASLEWQGRKPDGGCVYRVTGLNFQGSLNQKAILN